jgi:hypothetical protein
MRKVLLSGNQALFHGLNIRCRIERLRVAIVLAVAEPVMFLFQQGERKRNHLILNHLFLMVDLAQHPAQFGMTNSLQSGQLLRSGAGDEKPTARFSNWNELPLRAEDEEPWTDGSTRGPVGMCPNDK